jgi:hypothetical protein
LSFSRRSSCIAWKSWLLNRSSPSKFLRGIAIPLELVADGP